MDGLIQMGGYGGYVWPAYGVSLVVLLAVLAASILGARGAEQQLDAIQKSRRERRSQDPEGSSP